MESVTAARGGVIAGVYQGLVAGGLRVGYPEVVVVVVESVLLLVVVMVVACRGFWFWRLRRYSRLICCLLVSLLGLVPVSLSMVVVLLVGMEVV